MKNSCLLFRPFNVGGCFELKLHNGKTVLIDPFFPEDGRPESAKEDSILACDYILLTHTHFDHDMHVGYFVKKFNPKVIVQASAAIEEMIFHQIPIDNIIPIHHGQEFELDGLQIQGFMTKHASFGLRKYDPNRDITYQKFGLEGHKRADVFGDIECVNYLLTLDNGFTMAIVSGTDFSADIRRKVADHHVDLLLRQFGMRKNMVTTGETLEKVNFDSQITPEEFANVIAQYHAQIMMPFHFENTLKRWGEEKLRAYLNDASEIMRQIYPGGAILYPEAYRWYQVGLDVTPVK